MKKLIRKGEIKEVYEVSKERLEFVFTDNVTVFDKVIPDEIPRKGESLCKTSSYWFELIKEMGLKSHFVEKSDKRLMQVERIQGKKKPKNADRDSTDYLLPLQFISKHFVDHTLIEKIEDDRLDHRELGFEKIPDFGDRLNDPYLEIRAKQEEVDRILEDDEACSIGGLKKGELKKIKDIVFKIDDVIKEKVEKNDLLHVESNKEFALDDKREPVIVDTFGTAEEDRWWIKSEYEKGNIVEKNKDFLRNYYKDIGYHESLKESREKGKEEPPMPELSDEMINKTSEYYVDMMKRLTDGKYR